MQIEFRDRTSIPANSESRIYINDDELEKLTSGKMLQATITLFDGAGLTHTYLIVKEKSSDDK